MLDPDEFDKMADEVEAEWEELKKLLFGPDAIMPFEIPDYDPEVDG